MSRYILIPARLNSTRFPRKVIEPINGWPMVYLTYHAVKNANDAKRTMILVDGRPVEHICEIFRMPYAYTEMTCKNGTERCAEWASRSLNDNDIVVNVQADEPMMDVSIVNRLFFNVENKPEFVWTAVRPIRKDEPLAGSVFCRESNNFISGFGRERKSYHNVVHIGVYGYTVRNLKKYLESRQTQEEIELSLEQLRWLTPPAAFVCEYNGIGVDYPEDIKRVEERMPKRNDFYFMKGKKNG